MRGWSLILCLTLAALVGAAGCGKRKQESSGATPSAPAIDGLAAVPSAARVVIGVDVERLRRSPLVTRAVGQMLLRDPALAERLDRLTSECRFDPSRDLRGALIAMGSPEELLVVVSGAFDEGTLAACVNKAVAADGGRLVVKSAGGRTLYHAVGGDGVDGVWFALGSAETLVVASSESWLARSLGTDDKVAAGGELAGLLERAGAERGLWGAALVDPEIGRGLVEGTGGAVTEPPRAMFGHVDVAAGLGVELGVVMDGEKDANSAVSFGKVQLKTLALVAQQRGLGRLVSKVALESEGATVHLRLRLDEAELKGLISQIDSGGLPAQNPPGPAPGENPPGSRTGKPD